MIKSMTGYGKANLSQDNREYQIEIRSVNHRYLDISVKIPRILGYLEEEIKKCISNKVKRGKIDVFVNFQNNSLEGKEIKINRDVAKIYINELKQLAKQENISSEININEIAQYPDVLEIQNTQDEEKIKTEVIETVNIALDNFIEMKQIEGNKMGEDILKRIEKIKINVEKISSLSTGLIEEYVVKLKSRVQELLQNQEIDETRLAQEVVIFADKCSIEEEVTRLNSHILQFKNLVNSKEPIGKKLDFLIQEMNRETNTIGSKANNLEITNGVIDIKTELENIREQVQNIE